MSDALFTPQTPGGHTSGGRSSGTPPCVLDDRPSGDDYLQAMIIPLFNRQGAVAAATLVDPDLFPALARWRWSLDRHGYAYRTRRLGGGTSEWLGLHRVVMCCTTGDGMEIDHINRIRLDNRRSNLRFVTHAENMANTERAPRRRTEWRGERQPKPRWHAGRRRWFAELKYQGKSRWVGSFADYAAAAQALDEALKKAVAGS